MIDLDKLQAEMSDDQITKLRDYRGGCSCHINPPCSNCCDPLDMLDALFIGLISEEEFNDARKLEGKTEFIVKVGEPRLFIANPDWEGIIEKEEVKPDIMDITRRFC